MSWCAVGRFSPQCSCTQARGSLSGPGTTGVSDRCIVQGTERQASFKSLALEGDRGEKQGRKSLYERQATDGALGVPWRTSRVLDGDTDLTMGLIVSSQLKGLGAAARALAPAAAGLSPAATDAVMPPPRVRFAVAAGNPLNPGEDKHEQGGNPRAAG